MYKYSTLMVVRSQMKLINVVHPTEFVFSKCQNRDVKSIIFVNNYKSRLQYNALFVC